MTGDIGGSGNGIKRLLVRGINLPYTSDVKCAKEMATYKLKRLMPECRILSAEIFKRSVDARRRGDIRFIYTVSVEAEAPGSAKLPDDKDISEVPQEDAEIVLGTKPLTDRPVIIGFGPAGMFAALFLSSRGYRPLVLERGGSVDERVSAVENFYKNGKLDTNTNIQFGAGGAGTFSDGKLTTRIGDRRCRTVLDMLHRLGAPDDILVNAKPHIGTDILRNVVKNAAEEIIKLGGEIRYNSSVSDIVLRGGRADKLITTNGDTGCGPVILAVGHSARDTYAMLMRRGITVVPKPFSMGVRIEHLQSDIDAALYGECAGDPILPPAEYNMSRRFGDRAVYTFCMCPGGEVVAAASEEGGLVVNGMSSYARNGRNANSAIAVSLGLCSTPDEQIELQRRYERAAFAAGGGDYCAPVQTLGDFISGKCISEPGRVYPTYMNGNVSDPKVRAADISGIMNSVLGEDATAMMREALGHFGRQIRGFDAPDSIITGVESRTSAPVRIIRTPVYTSPDADNIYPCGEGAGYAGGIMSTAVDGIRCAEAVAERYAPFE